MVKELTEEMELAFKKQMGIVQWSMLLLQLYKHGGEQAVVVDKDMFDILEEAINEE